MTIRLVGPVAIVTKLDGSAPSHVGAYIEKDGKRVEVKFHELIDLDIMKPALNRRVLATVTLDKWLGSTAIK